MLPTLPFRLLSLALLLSLFAVGQPGFGAAIAVTVAAICVVLLARGWAGHAERPRAAIPESGPRRTIYRRLADPDASGRPRPRAPGFTR